MEARPVPVTPGRALGDCPFYLDHKSGVTSPFVLKIISVISRSILPYGPRGRGQDHGRPKAMEMGVAAGRGRHRSVRRLPGPRPAAALRSSPAAAGRGRCPRLVHAGRRARPAAGTTAAPETVVRPGNASARAGEETL